MYQANFKKILFILIIVQLASSYIDIVLTTVTSSADICLNMPMTIDHQQYHIAVSLTNQHDFIVSPHVMPHKKSATVSGRPKEAEMHVWSLEGYTL